MEKLITGYWNNNQEFFQAIIYVGEKIAKAPKGLFAYFSSNENILGKHNNYTIVEIA